MGLLHHQRVEVTFPKTTLAEPADPEVILSRAQSAHYRLSWHELLALNASVPAVGQITITLFGLPTSFATFLGLSTQM